MKNVEIMEQITEGVELDPETETELQELSDYESDLYDTMTL